MNVPSRFTMIPPIIQQLAEGSASKASSYTHRDNARRTLMQIKDFIEWVLREYPEPTIRMPGKPPIR